MRPPVLVCVVLLLAGCSGGTSKAVSSPPPGTATPLPASGPSLRIAGFGFHPAPLTVAPGTVITVTNADVPDHTVTSDKAGLFDVSAAQGEPEKLTAPAVPGTYQFHCSIHPSMHGSLVVS